MGFCTAVDSSAIGQACGATRCINCVQDDVQNGAREGCQKRKGWQGVSQPFREVRSKGFFEPQYENGVRGNTISDLEGLDWARCKVFVQGRSFHPLDFAVYINSGAKDITSGQVFLFNGLERSDSTENVATSPCGVLTGWPSSGANAVP